MYQVYTQQRPGRPRVAAAASAGLLLLTVGLAASLVQQRREASNVTLGDPQRLSAHLLARIPDGWDPIPTDELPAGVVYGVGEPPRGASGATRCAYVFEGFPNGLGLPMQVGRDHVTYFAQQLAVGIFFGKSAEGPADLAGLPAWEVELQPQQAALAFGEIQLVYPLGRAAVAPDGRVFGVMLMLDRPARSADRALLQELAAGMASEAVAIAEHADEAIAGAGLDFNAPSGTAVVLNADPTLRRVRMIGGEGSGPWYLDVYRVPLAESRTPETLLLDHVRAALEGKDPPDPVTTTQRGGHRSAHVEVPLSIPTGDRLMLWASDFGGQQGVFLIGRCAGPAAGTLREIGDRIAEETRPAADDAWIDPRRALLTGRRLLEEIATGGLDETWKRLEADRQSFDMRSSGLPLGTQQLQYKHDPDGDTSWWAVHIDTLQEDAMRRPRIRTTEDYGIRGDGTEHKLLYRLGGGSYEENLTSDPRIVSRVLRVERRPERRQDIEADDAYACEPVLIQAAARVAWDPVGTRAMFSTTSPYSEGLIYWLVEPVDAVDLPEGSPPGEIRAARFQRDFDPQPIVLYFDEHELLWAVTFDNGTEWVRSGQSEQ